MSEKIVPKKETKVEVVEYNKTKPCPWFFVLDSIECNRKKCNLECNPRIGGKRWK